MGTWETKLYEDDIAEDIKLDYGELLKKGKSNEETLKEIIEQNKDTIEDYDEGPVFWMVLADTMWNWGRLTKEVRDRAIEEIENGNNLKKWQKETTEKEYLARKKELEKLKEKLNSPMPTEKKIKILKESKNDYTGEEWKVGDTYAYKLETETARKFEIYGQYLIFRKIERIPLSICKRIDAVVYVQITRDGKLPQNIEELEKLEYIVIENFGNVKHGYVINLYGITKKDMKEKMIYLGNYADLKGPRDEHRRVIRNDVDFYRFKDIDVRFLEMNIPLGTNINPKIKKVNPEFQMDSKIRFLMRADYYEKALGITPPEKAMVKYDPLLYIALIDSMMIGGYVQNPVGVVDDEKKKEAFKRIEQLRKILQDRNEGEELERKLNILKELEEKIKNYQIRIFKI